MRPGETANALSAAGHPVGRAWERVGAGAEVALAVAALLVPGALTGGLVAATYALFAAFIVVALRRGWALTSCGCFGRPDSPPTIAHAVLDAGAAASAVWWGAAWPTGYGFDQLARLFFHQPWHGATVGAGGCGGGRPGVPRLDRPDAGGAALMTTTLLALLAAVVAVAAAVRSTWSPCGLSVLSSITPFGESSRAHRYGVTAGWFVAGAVAGGATLGAVAAGLAAGVSTLDLGRHPAWVAGALAALVGAAAAVDAGLFGAVILSGGASSTTPG